jgi:hypothetical protein
MGDLREIQLESDMNREVGFLFDYGQYGQPFSAEAENLGDDTIPTKNVGAQNTLRSTAQSLRPRRGGTAQARLN